MFLHLQLSVSRVPAASDEPPPWPLTFESHSKSIKMKHLAAYLLLGLGGNTSPSASDITSVLDSVGIEADSDRLAALLKELKGKDINEV